MAQWSSRILLAPRTVVGAYRSIERRLLTSSKFNPAQQVVRAFRERWWPCLSAAVGSRSDCRHPGGCRQRGGRLMAGRPCALSCSDWCSGGLGHHRCRWCLNSGGLGRDNSGKRRGTRFRICWRTGWPVLRLRQPQEHDGAQSRERSHPTASRFMARRPAGKCRTLRTDLAGRSPASSSDQLGLAGGDARVDEYLCGDACCNLSSSRSCRMSTDSSIIRPTRFANRASSSHIGGKKALTRRSRADIPAPRSGRHYRIFRPLG